MVALVDNGVTHHSDLDANILPGMDLLTGHRGQGDGFNPGITTETCSVVWHGTNVMGPLAAVTNNGVGVAGTAGEAKVVPVRVLDACGKGMVSDMADGITWAGGGSLPGIPDNPYPAKVVNASIYGYGSCSNTLQEAIDDVTARGASVVTIAGNNETDAAKYQPGNCRNVIVVGNVTANGMRGYMSNYGPNVDIAAPGYSVWTTYNNGTSTPGPESYGYAQGTSIAAPFVSGVIALVQSVAPKPLTPSEMRALLMQTAHAFGPEKPNFPLGAGVVDATAAVVAAKSGKIPATADFKCSQSRIMMQMTCTDLSTARGESIRSWDWNFGTGDPDFTRTESVNPYVNYDYPGTYRVTLKVTDSNGAASNITRPFLVNPPTVQDITGQNGPTKFSVAPYEMTYFSVAVPSGSKSLSFTLSPGAYSEIATLYLRAGTPSMLHPDCQSVMVRGAAATCTISNPTPGIYYAIQSSTTSLNGVSIQYSLK